METHQPAGIGNDREAAIFTRMIHPERADWLCFRGFRHGF
jgi:hypothetical protein